MNAKHFSLREELSWTFLFLPLPALLVFVLATEGRPF